MNKLSAPEVLVGYQSLFFSLSRSFTVRLGFLLLVCNSVQAETIITLNLPQTLYNYSNLPLPAHFNDGDIIAADTTPSDNPVTDAGATLGRVLFYDRKLSLNDTTSCASCHLQSLGFSDSAQFSIGFNGETTHLHSMGLANARYYNSGRFFWDERASTLEEQVLIPIEDPVEMGMNLDDLVAKLSSTTYYSDLFENAFGTSIITNDRVARALAQFIRSMLSYRSKFDRGVRNNFANYSAREEQGRLLFNSNQTHCRTCHRSNIQALDEPRNIGLDAIDSEPGAGDGKFKAPSLRNIAIRPPYMHDGRFNTLEEVVAFYNDGIQDNPNLDTHLREQGQVRQMNLTDTEQAAIVAFLETLTDTSFLTDPIYSDPFIYEEVTDPPIDPPTPPTTPREPSPEGMLMAPIINLLLDEGKAF